MATVRPFRAVRPEKKLASRIAALPYDVYSRKEAREEVKREPCSFLKIDRAETQLDPDVDIYSEEVYRQAGATLDNMIQAGELIREEKPCFYLYELTMNGRSQTGLGCCVSVKEYETQVIKKHENTRVEKENDRVRHVEACQAQTGPVFLAYRSEDEMDRITEQEKKKEPVYDFTAEDGIRHRIWILQEESTINKIQKIFEKVENLYIADGHHRAAAAVRVAEKRRQGKETQEESEYFLAVAFPDRELMILDYNRWVRDLWNQDRETFLHRLEENFVLEKMEKAVHPSQKGEIAMYLKGQWYLLREKKAIWREDPIQRLDVSILQKEILAPVLGITEPRTDQRIVFVGGIRGLADLERRVDQEGGVAFAMYPTSMDELFEVADQGRLMPPKSTWFEPKLRSGLLIHQIN